MILELDPHSGVPVYRQLVDQIRYLVATGVLRAGDELPSTRSLSSRLHVNPMTISRAFQLLEQEGVLERRPGRPLVVRDRDDGDARSSRLDQLRQELRPVAGKARQLGVGPGEALRLFGELLDEGEE